ncbi:MULTISPECIES: copper resistance CopC family protein [unclassified Cryobacterium]|uniref:copper resistance CopC family protein n=1 Tax=unclassified Cryobacterium TaxID=2649013 RepID=UPI001F54294D|nr:MULTISPECIES: copper resistance CopC family protein [unclassified Cryobacterium]
MAPIRNSRRHARMLKRSALAGAVLAVASLGATAAPAFAHNYLVGSTPAAGSIVTEQPGTVSITTNDNLLDLSGQGEGSVIQVTGPADAPRYYGDGCSTIAGPTLETAVQLGQPGEYTVTWQVVSTDGHPISDTFTFTWQPDAAQVLNEGSATAPECATAGSGQTGPANSEAAGADAAESGSAVDVTDLLWIGGALVAILAAIGVTLLLLRRPTPK